LKYLDYFDARSLDPQQLETGIMSLERKTTHHSFIVAAHRLIPRDVLLLMCRLRGAAGFWTQIEAWYPREDLPHKDNKDHSRAHDLTMLMLPLSKALAASEGYCKTRNDGRFSPARTTMPSIQ
jgi:hypothetical protein